MLRGLSASLSGSRARPGYAGVDRVAERRAFPSGNVTRRPRRFDGLLLNPLHRTGQWCTPGTLAPYGHITVGFTANVPANINLLGTVRSYTAAVSNTTSRSEHCQQRRFAR
ncbi:MAG: hypothetical protein IPL52_17825 [Flavobacteriales bacterium]|nr:hypothetical protein [Flavobacteriales bacterium]